jgi:hypothetical protein
MKNAAYILSFRARNALVCHVHTVEPKEISERWKRDDPDPKIIAKYTSRELMRIPNFGWRSLTEVMAWLDEYGLKLADDPHKKRCPTCGQILRMTETCN